MATKQFFFFTFLLSLALYSSTLSTAATVIHVSSAVPAGSSPVTVVFKILGNLKKPINLNPGQEITLNATGNQKYFANAIYNGKFTPFNPYDPIRDQGKADVYWRATDGGFEISYDKTKWKLVAPWTTD